MPNKPANDGYYKETLPTPKQVAYILNNLPRDGSKEVDWFYQHPTFSLCQEIISILEDKILGNLEFRVKSAKDLLKNEMKIRKEE